MAVGDFVTGLDITSFQPAAILKFLSIIQIIYYFLMVQQQESLIIRVFK